MGKLKKLLALILVVALVSSFNWSYFGELLVLTKAAAMECLTGGSGAGTALSAELQSLSVSKFFDFSIDDFIAGIWDDISGDDEDSEENPIEDVAVNDTTEETTEEKGTDNNSELLDDKINQAREAQKIAADLSDKYGYGEKSNKKTVASDGNINTLSGWKALDENSDFTRVAPEVVIDKSNEIGHKLRNSGANDQGTPGKYNASHAEKQLSIISEQPIGISQPMCSDCQNYFKQLSIKSGKVYIIADTNTIRIFNPDGSVNEIE